MKIENEIIYTKIVKQITENTITLPILPIVVQELHKVMHDDNSSIGDIANVVQVDTTMSARVVQIANSPALRGFNKVASIKDALTRLGLKMVRNIAMTVALRDTFSSKHKELNKICVDTFKSGVDISHFAYQFAKRNKEYKINPDTANFAGIIFNLGKLPVISYFENCDICNPEEIRLSTNDLRCSINFLTLTKWDVAIEILEATCKNRISPDSMQLGDVLLVIEAYLNKDDSILNSSNPFVQDVWRDIAQNYDEDMKGANDLKKILVG